MSDFDKQCGRLRVRIGHDGLRMHDYHHGVKIECPDGWNDSCKVQTHTMSVNEMRDLHYMLGRAIDAATSEVRKLP